MKIDAAFILVRADYLIYAEFNFLEMKFKWGVLFQWINFKEIIFYIL